MMRKCKSRQKVRQTNTIAIFKQFTPKKTPSHPLSQFQFEMGLNNCISFGCRTCTQTHININSSLKFITMFEITALITMPIQLDDVWPVCILCCWPIRTRTDDVHDNNIFKSLSAITRVCNQNCIGCVFVCVFFFTLYILFLLLFFLLCLSVTNCDALESSTNHHQIIIFTLESLNSYKWIWCSSLFTIPPSPPRPQSIQNKMLLHIIYSFYLLASRLAITFLCALFCLRGKLQ